MTSTNTDKGFICLYFGNPEECQNCGGSAKAEGGPFEPDPRFCSQDCAEDAAELAARMAERTAAAWCPACGYDRGEHAPGCKRPNST